MKIFKIFLILLIVNIHAEPTASAICSAGCAAMVVACYGAVGFVLGIFQFQNN
jgi:hypothetical protein